MAGLLEKIAEESGSAKVLERREYSAGRSTDTTSYSVFAEMYLEKPVMAEGITCSICTFRSIPTIDDW